MRIREVDAKTILVQTKLPDADYVVNPYTGCTFGCTYCYACFMGRFAGEPLDSWGSYVHVKVNAVEVLKRQLGHLSPEARMKSVFLSSVTDPYQGAEARYRLTRGILETLMEEGNPGFVSVLTKSPLVVRDTDIFTKLANAEVGLTVTTTDDDLSRFLEGGAPNASSRLRALAQLREAGVNTYAFVGPLLPHFRCQPDKLDELIRALARTGVESVYVEHLNLTKPVQTRLGPLLQQAGPDVRRAYAESGRPEHQQALSDLVVELLKHHGIRLRMNGVIRHGSAEQGDTPRVPRSSTQGVDGHDQIGPLARP